MKKLFSSAQFNLVQAEKELIGAQDSMNNLSGNAHIDAQKIKRIIAARAGFKLAQIAVQKEETEVFEA